MPKFLDNIEFYDNDGVLRKITDLESSITEAEAKALENIEEAGTTWTETLGIDAFVDFRDSHNNIENGTGAGSLQQVSYSEDPENTKNPVASGIGSVAFGGFRYDYVQQGKLPDDKDTTNTAAGNQSFVAGCGNFTAGDWSFVTGKDNTVYSNRAFVSGGANVSQAVDSNGNFIEEKTNAGRFNAIFGNNNTFKSSNVAKESNLIAGGSNTVDTERSIVVGYSNNVSGSFDAIFGQGHTINANRSIVGGEANTVDGGYHLVTGISNTVYGQSNIASGQGNENGGWQSAAIGKGLIVGRGNTAQTVLGQYNDNKSNTVLEIGWGDPDDRKNIFEVYRDGVVKTEQGTLSTENYVQNYISSLTKLEIGQNNDDSIAVRSITVGLNSKNKGYQSAAIGDAACVGYDSEGNPISYTPTGSAAFGWSRSNYDYCFSAGRNTEANSLASSALGNETITGRAYQTVVGSFNSQSTEALFVVGNGDGNGRKNAFEVLTAGGFKSYGYSTIEGSLSVTEGIDTNGYTFTSNLYIKSNKIPGADAEIKYEGSSHSVFTLPDTNGTNGILTTKEEVASTYLQKSKISFSNGVLTIDLS